MSVDRSARSLAPVLGFLAASWLAPAWAGNDEGIFVGNQAALTAGAVTALVADGSAAWYNPAGLAHSTRPTLDLAVSVYGFRQISVDQMVVAPDGSSADASFTDWMLVPSGLSFARNLGKRLSVGIGLFVPRVNDYVLRAKVTDTAGTTWIAAGQEVFAAYNLAVSLAWRYSDNLRFGASLLGTYASTYSAFEFAGGDPAADGAAQVSEIFGAQNYGLRLNAGMQWSWNRRFALGVTLVSPGMTVLTSRERTRATTLTSVAADDVLEIDDQSDSGFTWRMTEPLKVRAGFAWHTKRGYVSIDGDLALPVDLADENASAALLEFDRDWNWNARLGGMFGLNDRIWIGGGFFTDLNPRRRGGLDFFGVAFGLSFRNEYKLDSGRPISFHTTLGVRYAYGTGESLRLEVSSLQQVDGVALGESDSSAHELSGSVGSMLHF